MVFMLINSHAANYSKKHCQSFDCAHNMYKSYGLQTYVFCCRHQVLSYVWQSQIITQLPVGTGEG